MTLVPTGVGQSRPLESGRLAEHSGISGGRRWTPDGRRIVFVGNEAGGRRRVFVQDVAGGLPEPVTPEGAFGPIAVSPDSTWIVTADPDRRLSKYPIAGGAGTPLAGALPGDEPLAWGRDGDSIWVLNRVTTPAQIFRVELRSGHRSHWRDIPYPDPASIEPETLRVVMSADGSRFVYGYQKHLTELYVAEGLR